MDKLGNPGGQTYRQTDRQTVTLSPKENTINKMTYSLYPCILLFGTNIIIYGIFVHLALFNNTTPIVPTFDFSSKYNVLHDTT